jgi:predicted nucleotidyltransferase
MPSLRSADRPEQELEILRQHEAELRRRQVKSLHLFGSVARGEASERSDVDLLVEFERDVGLFAFLRLKRFLEEILERPVDLVTTAALRPQWRDQVLREALRAA